MDYALVMLQLLNEKYFKNWRRYSQHDEIIVEISVTNYY